MIGDGDGVEVEVSLSFQRQGGIRRRGEEDLPSLRRVLAQLRGEVHLGPVKTLLAGVQQTLDEFGGLDIVINNAGIEISQLLIDTDPEQCLGLLNINVIGTMLGMKHAFQVMKPEGAAGKGGVILNLASVAAISATPGLAVYSASKAAVTNLTSVGAAESGRQGYGVRVNSLCPSLIDTAMGRKLIADFADMGFGESAGAVETALLDRMPIGRFGLVEDVVQAALYLCSERSSFLTGVSLPVDGGMSIPE